MGNTSSEDASATAAREEPEDSGLVWTDAGMKADVEFLEAVSNKAHPLTPVVLVGSGAFCPVHRGHLLMMRAAAKALPKET